MATINQAGTQGWRTNVENALVGHVACLKEFSAELHQLNGKVDQLSGFRPLDNLSRPAPPLSTSICRRTN